MPAKKPRGVSLIELVVFIVIVGVGMAGIFAAYNTMTAGSPDPQVRKQVLAIAESLLEEVMLMPFTYCDPNDANAATATSANTPPCLSNHEGGLGSEPGESRYSVASPFDNVNDYHGFSMSPIKDIANDDVDGLSGYTASVSISQVSMGPGTPADPHDAIPSGAALLIAVTVTGPTGYSLTLEGYRTRYSPKALP